MPPTGPSVSSVCLLSGGMDSCVTAAIALRQGPAAFLHISYGQRTWERERRAFREMSDYYRVGLSKEVSFDFLREIGGSALTDPSIPLPEADPGREGIPVSYVPFRNALFLALAVSWAEVLGAESVFIGAVEQDSSGYPDCRQTFYDAYNRVIREGTRPESRISVVTPLIAMKKSEIVKLGQKLGAPFSLSWSCYQAAEKACGRCDSCLLRRTAFRQAGCEDPIPYDDPVPPVSHG